MKYRVKVHQVTEYEVLVDADSTEDAKYKAECAVYNGEADPSFEPIKGILQQLTKVRLHETTPGR